MIKSESHDISKEVAQVRQQFAEGNVKFGSIDDFLAEVDEP
jgi:hypothetical protein